MANDKIFFLFLVFAAGCVPPPSQSEGPVESQVMGTASTPGQYEKVNKSLKELVEGESKRQDEKKAVAPLTDSREEQRGLNLVPR